MGKTARRILLYGIGTSAVAVLVFLGFLYEPPPSEDVDITFIELQMAGGNYQKARESLTSYLEKDPKHLRALLIDAYCAEKLVQNEDAIVRYRAALNYVENQDQEGEIRVAMALIENRRERPKEGLTYLKDLQAAKPLVQSKLQFAEASCRLALGEKETARALYQRVQKSCEGNIELLRLSSFQLEILGEIEDATRGYEAASAKGDWESKFLLSRLKFFSGEPDKGCALLRELGGLGSPFLSRRLAADDEYRKAIESREGCVPTQQREGK